MREVVVVTRLFFVGTDIRGSFLLADIQGQVPRALMDADYLNFVHMNSWSNEHLATVL